MSHPGEPTNDVRLPQLATAEPSSRQQSDILSLADWRRAVAEMYAHARNAPQAEQALAWQTFRAARDHLFKRHPQSPLEPEQRAAFNGLAYYPYDPDWRVIGAVDADVPHETLRLQLAADGDFRYTRVARVRFTVCGVEAQLNLFWIEGYGGGLFLPFKDATTNRGSYGGGRYLYDTIKGADLGAYSDEIVLDFNYAYNPSCAYSPRWFCPLPPSENTLPFAVEAGEMDFIPAQL